MDQRFKVAKGLGSIERNHVTTLKIAEDWIVDGGYQTIELFEHIYSKVGYRAYYDDFRDESDHNFLYQLWFHGVQITAGLNF